MSISLDHLILPVNDAGESVRFYTELLGLSHEGEDGPFQILRVAPEFTIQLAPWGTQGGMHLAFAMTPSEFEAAFQRVRDTGTPYGDSFESVGNMQGPGTASGARGPGQALYFFDPSQHLLEIRTYA